MFSLKLVSSLSRNVTALAANQLGPATTGTKSSFIHYSQPQCYHPQRHQPGQPDSQIRLLCTSLALESPATLKPSVKSLKKLSSSDLAEAELDLPPKPKKPITPWIAFVREKKDEVLSQSSDKMGAAELALILSKEWKFADKTKYEEKYERLRHEYREQVKIYENSLNDQHREYLKLKKNLQKEQKAIREIRKTNPPRLPRNPSNLYSSERCKEPEVKERMKRGSAGQVFKELFEEYRAMSPEEKSRFVAMQQNDKLRFQDEFTKWYESVHDNDKLSKAAREQANTMYARFKALNYI